MPIFSTIAAKFGYKRRYAPLRIHSFLHLHNLPREKRERRERKERRERERKEERK